MTAASAGVAVRVQVRPRWPFELPTRLGRDGLARVRGGVIERLLHAGEQPVLVRVAAPARDRVLFAAQAQDEAAAQWGVARMRVALGVDEDLAPFYERFRFDPLIGAAVRADPLLRITGRPEPFEALVLAICEQLIDYQRAAAIQRRIVALLGRRCERSGMRDAPTAAVLAGQAPALLESLGLSAGRSVALVRAAREVATGRVDLYDREHERGWRRLQAIRGIGSWTVQMLALTGQRRLDQLPAGDLAYLKLVGWLRTGDAHARASEEDVSEFFAPYAPWAGLAGVHALHAVTAGTGRRLTAR
ncbi:MAG: hypothetical protein ABSG43_11130 [Solirubrobacteraceae bacterium]